MEPLEDPAGDSAQKLLQNIDICQTLSYNNIAGRTHKLIPYIKNRLGSQAVFYFALRLSRLNEKPPLRWKQYNNTNENDNA